MSPEIPSRLNLKILSPVELLVEREVDSVSLPGLDGYLGILPGHRAMLILLGRGEITYVSGGREEHVAAGGGTAEIRPDSVLVFVSVLEEDTEGSDDT